MRPGRISTRSVVRALAALAVAAMLVGPSAHAGTPTRPARAPVVGHGHAVPHPRPDFMMGPHCGATGTI